MLGAFISDRMKELGLNVRDVAQATGLTESGIYYIRRGERTQLQPETWLKLSAVLDVPLDTLMEKASAPPEEDAQRNGGGTQARKTSVAT